MGITSLMPSRTKISRTTGGIFRAIGFSPAEAAKLEAKSALVDAITQTIKQRGLSQIQAARLCKVRSADLGCVLRGRMETVTIDMLIGWLNALGRNVELRVRSHGLRVEEGKILVFSQH